MSLILDALRKMEQERKARQGGSVDLRPEVLATPRGNGPRPSSVKPLILVTAGIGILAAGVGGGIVLTGNQTERIPLQARITVKNEVPPEESSPVTVPPPPSVESSKSVKPYSAPEAIRQTHGATRQAPPLPRLYPPAAPAPIPVQRPAVAEQPAPSEYPGADITVSGIAWQEERGLRRAVVNGNLVGEGAEVAGARVVEIGERRVKFSQGGRTISVSLASPFQGR